MTARTGWTVRPASESDRPLIHQLIERGGRLHQHLDWTGPFELIGSPPFMLALKDGSPLGCLACPLEPAAPAWVRLFAVAEDAYLNHAWETLWERSQSYLVEAAAPGAAVLCLSNWVRPLAEGVGFRPAGSIVFLEWRGGPLDAPDPQSGIIREMEDTDFQMVLQVDNQAFDFLWTMSAETLFRAYAQANYVTVLELEGRIVGYQLSTSSVYGAHLARLAVTPQAQGKGVGTALVQDLLQRFRQTGVSRITVNTQADNLASLALYRRLGFESTDHTYPILLNELDGDRQG